MNLELIGTTLIVVLAFAYVIYVVFFKKRDKK
jgi:uncharacterized membrane protein YukC